MKWLIKNLKIYFIGIAITSDKFYRYEYEFYIFGHKFQGEFLSRRYLGVFDGDKWRGLVGCEENN